MGFKELRQSIFPSRSEFYELSPERQAFLRRTSRQFSHMPYRGSGSPEDFEKMLANGGVVLRVTEYDLGETTVVGAQTTETIVIPQQGGN